MPGLLDPRPAGLLSPAGGFGSNRQALGAGLLNAGAAMLQGGQRGLLANIGQGLAGFNQGYAGALDRQRDDYLYDLKIAELESDRKRREASLNAAQNLLANPPEDPPEEIRRLIDYHVQAQDPEGAAKVYHEWATTPPNTDAPTVREFYEGDKVFQKAWNASTRTWDVVGEGPRWAPQQPDGVLIEIADPNSPTGTRFVPRAQAAGQPGPNSSSGVGPLVPIPDPNSPGKWIYGTREQALGQSAPPPGGMGGLSETQTANNAEIDAAWATVSQMSPDELLAASEQFLSDGITPNPDYKPHLARLLTLATQRKVGADPAFQERWNYIYGSAAPQSTPSEPPRSVMLEGVSGTFTGEYEDGLPVYRTPDGRRFVVEQ